MTVLADLDQIVKDMQAYLKEQMEKGAGSGGGTWTTESSLDHDILDVQVETVDPTVKPLAVNHLTYTNDDPEGVTAKFPELTTKTISTFSYSFTEALKVTSKSTVKVQIPLIGEFDEELDVEVDVSSTQTQTTTQEQDWTYDAPIAVPPHKKVCAQLLIDHGTYNPSFSVKVRLTGGVSVEGDWQSGGRSGGSRESMGITDWFHMHPDRFPGATLGDDGGVTFVLSGKMEAVAGSNLRIDVHAVEIGAPCPKPVQKAQAVA